MGLTNAIRRRVMLSAGAVRAQAPVPDSPQIEAKSQAMLSKLTLEQKIELIGGVNDMFRPAANTGRPIVLFPDPQ